MLPVGPDVSDGFQKNILMKMNGDDIYMAIRQDTLILKYGQHEYGRLGHEIKYHRTIMDRSRELGRLLLTAKGIDPTVTSLSSLLRSTKYQLFKGAVKLVGRFNEETASYEAPSLVLKLGISMRKCANILKGEYLQDDILRTQVP
jgi:hypothetical protein